LRFKRNVIVSLAAMILGAVLYAAGQEQAKGPDPSPTTSSSASDSTPSSTASHPKIVHDASESHFEGEKRFRANCGRCHMAPHKFPPRMMATIVRHMRVRATITDEDMRFILAYMTE